METRQRYALLVSFAGLAIVVGVIYYFVFGYGAQLLNMNKFRKQYTNVKAIHLAGDYDAAVSGYQALLDSAPNKSIEGKTMILRAGALYSRNEGDDRAQSMKIYKAVVNDYRIPPDVRATALNNIANRVTWDGSEAFYRLNLSEPPYEDFLPASGTGREKISQAYLKILQLSDETYPNSYAKYAIAGNYYAPLLANNKFKDVTPESVAEIMQAYVKDGDALKDETQRLPNVKLRAYLYRALALNASNRVLKNLELGQVEEAFKRILDTAIPDTLDNPDVGVNDTPVQANETVQADDIPSRALIMRSRFFYANFLMEFYSDQRNEDIKALLASIAQTATGDDLVAQRTRQYFTSLAKSSSTTFLNSRARKLADISAEFKQFLIKMGFADL